MTMKTGRSCVRWGIALVAATQLTACSKSIEWDEDVLLNTGETIQVHRTDRFERRTEAGNPLQPAWWPEARLYEFAYGGRTYRYESPARQSPGAMAIAIDAGEVFIVDRVRNCRRPGLAVWHWTGTDWQAPPETPATLLGTKRNLMALRSPDGDLPQHVSIAARHRLDEQVGVSPHVDELNPMTAASGCRT